MKAQDREEQYVEMLPDVDAEYDGEMEINLERAESADLPARISRTT